MTCEKIRAGMAQLLPHSEGTGDWTAEEREFAWQHVWAAGGSSAGCAACYAAWIRLLAGWIRDHNESAGTRRAGD